MRKACYGSLVLLRFDDLKQGEGLNNHVDPETLFRELGADVRAACTSHSQYSAYKFALYGLHASEVSARKAIQQWSMIVPWAGEATEVWKGVLKPFRHFGDANFLGQVGSCYETEGETPPPQAPILIVTSVGWDSTDGEAGDRIKRFGEGVGAVRVGMTGMPGLHSQQSFSFPGGFVHDGITVTMWHDLSSAMAFAYGPGFHRSQVKIQREGPYGDRTSFTRFLVTESSGTWHGSNLYVGS